tara:strand:+ start:857 stop:1324 length:468 start_codon:yes stop_codon:yes gene_type:complete
MLDKVEWKYHEPADRGRRDEQAGLSFAEMWEKRLRRKDDAQHIRVHLACEILVVHALEQTSEPIGRIVEQHVHASELGRLTRSSFDLARSVTSSGMTVAPETLASSVAFPGCRIVATTFQSRCANSMPAARPSPVPLPATKRVCDIEFLSLSGGI